MTPQEAYSAFQKKHKKLTVTECIDYDKDHYVFVAVENPNEPDYSDPYYAVNKRNGEVSFFSPAGDIEAWVDAIETRSVKWK